MSCVRVTVNAGICGFVTEITAASDDEQHVRFTIVSACAHQQALAASLPPMVDAYAEIGAGYDGVLWQAVRQSLRGCCSGCVTPPAIFKAMQVAGGVALPCDSAIRFEPVEEDA